MELELVTFKSLSIDDPFFTTLKQDYTEFTTWFNKKAASSAYITRAADGKLHGFLYLKEENEELAEVTPPRPARSRLKVGTFKIDAHGTKLGERFMKKIFDHALHARTEEIYVTVFEKHVGLLNLLTRYGFAQAGTIVTANGTELVLVRNLFWSGESRIANYPLIKLSGAKIYLLSLKPKWHTRLLPDSILKNESAEIVQDVSHANSIQKVYLAAMAGMEKLEPGDLLVIYRTSDQDGNALHRSVATSICVMEDYRHISSFHDEESFLDYCRPYSVFTEEELRDLWLSKKYPKIIRFTYNIALRRRPNRRRLIEECGLFADKYWGFLELSSNQFSQILKIGEVDASLIFN